MTFLIIAKHTEGGMDVRRSCERLGGEAAVDAAVVRLDDHLDTPRLCHDLAVTAP
jgi:hypothetical protein